MSALKSIFICFCIYCCSRQQFKHLMDHLLHYHMEKDKLKCLKRGMLLQRLLWHRLFFDNSSRIRWCLICSCKSCDESSELVALWTYPDEHIKFPLSLWWIQLKTHFSWSCINCPAILSLPDDIEDKAVQNMCSGPSAAWKQKLRGDWYSKKKERTLTYRF